MKVLLLLCMCMCLVVVLCTPAHEDWIAYKKKYPSKIYDESEDQEHEEIFERSLQKINDHNIRAANGEFSYTQGINVFSDMKPEQRGRYRGLRM
ncbi:unnamed protein product [Diamesa hyperborea]